MAGKSIDKLGPNGVYLLIAAGIAVSALFGFLFGRESASVFFSLCALVLLVYSIKAWSLKIEAYDKLRHRFRDRTSRYQQLLTHTPEGILMLKNGAADFVNPAFKKLFGVNEDIDGRRLQEIDLPEELLHYYNEGRFSETLVIPAKNKNLPTLEVRVLVPDEEHAVIIAYDITQENRVSEMRRDFVANASRELQAPLLAAADVLKSEAEFEAGLTEEEKTRLADSIQRRIKLTKKIHRMNLLIDDLLTICRLEAAKDSPESEPDVIDVSTLVSESIQKAQALSAGRHKFEVSCDDVYLIAFREEVQAALDNLLSNAVRYTPEGGTITVKWKESADGAKLLVKDTGIGIPEEHLARLSERFYRVDQDKSRETGGTGLGLSIVKHIARHNKGELAIKSKENEGSTFSMEFPRSQVFKQTL